MVTALRPRQRAPGADDNGSGSAAVLELARVIQESGVQLRHTLRLCLFTGEEQARVPPPALLQMSASNDKHTKHSFSVSRIQYGIMGVLKTTWHFSRAAACLVH